MRSGLIALRHGHSLYNERGLCNDSDAGALGLSVKGFDQARRARKALATEHFSAVYSSPLLRTRQTAEIVTERMPVTFAVDARLADIRSGFDGKPVVDYLAAIAHDPVDARVNGGESLRDYACRVTGFLEELEEQSSGMTLLVVHEETLRVIDA
ncbi:MAG: histidine phosphatase family protein, partial [Kangiellaceae bacterium]|nr:histidine phosphatase family protein [Kangiellaceae bacterium]